MCRDITSSNAEILEDISGLTVAASYDFRARTTRNGEDSNWSDVFTVAGKPGSPTDLTAAQAPGGIALTWTPPTETGDASLTSYHVQFREDAVGNWDDNPATGNAYPGGDATSFTVTTVHGLQNGVSYNFRIRASNVARSSFFHPNDGSVEAMTAISDEVQREHHGEGEHEPGHRLVLGGARGYQLPGLVPPDQVIDRNELA